MTRDRIKNQIESYLRQYKENAGTFEGLKIIFDYVNFLKTEPYIKEVLGNIFDYAESQKQIMLKLNEKKELEQYNIRNLTPDVNNPLSSFPAFPFFKKEEEEWREKTKNKEDFNAYGQTAVFLMSLINIYDLMTKIKDNMKSGNIEKANRLTKTAIEASMIIIPFQVKDEKGDLKNTSINTASFHLLCMQLVGKHIFDKIDSEAFLTDSQTKAPISFDKDKSLLYIRGTDVKITSYKIRTIEHCILECIFSESDIFREVDFSEIFEKFLKDENRKYDKEKDWYKFWHACERLNNKVDKSTNGLIKDFLEYSTSHKGWCKINHKYS